MPAGGSSGQPQEGPASRQRAPLPTHVRDLPPLPPAAEAALDDGLRGLGLARDPVVAGARGAFLDHLRLLLAWTAAINLTAIREPVDMVRLHLLDSLTAIRPLRAAGIDRFLDLGTGAGLPGLPLALGLPAADALLVDSTAKKIAFVDTAVAALGVGATVRTAAIRAETLALDPAHRERWPAITCRAVADLAELAALGLPLVEPGGLLVAWKRGDPRAGPLADELERGRRAIADLGGGDLEILPAGLPELPGHLLVVVRKTGRTAPATPRDQATRRRTGPEYPDRRCGSRSSRTFMPT